MNNSTDDIDQIIEAARRGDGRYAAVIRDHLRCFRHVVLRGAGRFGNAFGNFLLQDGFPKERLCYWDIRAHELQQVHDIPVRLPFTGPNSPAETLVINCIPNGSLSGSVGRGEFLAHGYTHYLSGMALFEALMCDMRSETGFDSKVCIDTPFCNWCACQRLPSMLLKQCRDDGQLRFEDELVLPLLTFVVNQKCTLKCTHCGQYINHYHPDDRINFPLEHVLSDIDRMFDAIDAIGYVSLIGGEPFLHPALDRIIEHILSKPNFGVLGITTNGICDISDEFLAGLDRQRTRLIFSDYTAALDDKQRALFQRNVNRIAAAGVSHTAGQPLWATPASLRKLDMPDDSLKAMKASCNSRHTCKTVQNGVYYPCSTTAGIGSHRQASYPGDWIALDEITSPAELRARIKKLDEADFYASCDHCGEGGEMLALSGEQGKGRQYSHIESSRFPANDVTDLQHT
jgi:hypothetical protein